MITSIIGKIVEMHMISHANPILNPEQSHLQFGFSPNPHEAKNNNDALYITFLDTSNAFSVVNHKGMLNAFHAQGLQDTLLSLFEDMYTDIKSVVKWEGKVSMPLGEWQGIRHVGFSSTRN